MTEKTGQTNESWKTLRLYTAELFWIKGEMHRYIQAMYGLNPKIPKINLLDRWILAVINNDTKEGSRVLDQIEQVELLRRQMSGDEPVTEIVDQQEE